MEKRRFRAPRTKFWQNPGLAPNPNRKSSIRHWVHRVDPLRKFMFKVEWTVCCVIIVIRLGHHQLSLKVIRTVNNKITGTESKLRDRPYCTIKRPSTWNVSGQYRRNFNIIIKPDTPINVYTGFCLNTAKSKFSLVSPVAGWWETINKQLNWMIY